MLWLAYDGSLNSDWLSHYAVRCAHHTKEKCVTSFFVQDGSLSETEVREKFSRAQRVCHNAGVSFEGQILPMRNSVSETLLASIPAKKEELLLCGTRVQQRHLGFLGGTVSETLLRRAPFRVLALRIVTPGLLGATRRLLVPVMGRPEGITPALPFIKTLSHGLTHLFILSVHPSTPPSLWAKLSARYRPWSEGQRRSYVEQTTDLLRQSLNSDVSFDGTVVLSNDPAGEIVLAAKQQRSELIVLGLSQRPLAERKLLGTPGETILRYAPCDVGVFGGAL